MLRFSFSSKFSPFRATGLLAEVTVPIWGMRVLVCYVKPTAEMDGIAKTAFALSNPLL